jgi:predicted GIY-YIG superfamily endonuclease
MLGYVYVVTTNRYLRKSTFKIGFTTDLIQRLKLFNATRIDDDLFYCVRHWRTIHYSKLEAFLHAQLSEYRLKNEFFEVSLNLVESNIEEFAKINGPQFFYDDVVLVKKELFEVQWIPSKHIFIYNDELRTKKRANSGRQRGKSRIKYVDEIGMREVVVEWLSCVDVYGLLKFTCCDAISRLVELLKEAKTEEEVIDLSKDFRKLKL